MSSKTGFISNCRRFVVTQTGAAAVGSVSTAQNKSVNFKRTRKTLVYFFVSLHHKNNEL